MVGPSEDTGGVTGRWNGQSTADQSSRRANPFGFAVSTNRRTAASRAAGCLPMNTVRLGGCKDDEGISALRIIVVERASSGGDDGHGLLAVFPQGRDGNRPVAGRGLWRRGVLLCGERRQQECRRRDDRSPASTHPRILHGVDSRPHLYSPVSPTLKRTNRVI